MSSRSSTSRICWAPASVAAAGTPPTPNLVVADVVDPVRERLGVLTECAVRVVVHVDPFRILGRPPVLAPIGVPADQFLLLGVHTDHRLTRGEPVGHNTVEVLELGVAVRMRTAFDPLGRRLQRVAHLVQQPANQLRRNLEPFRRQLSGQLIGRRQRPPQRRLGMPTGLGPHQLVESFEQTGLLVDRRLVTSPPSTQRLRRLDPRRHLSLTLGHRVTTQARRLSHRGLAATTDRSSRRPRNNPPLLLAIKPRSTDNHRERLSTSGAKSDPCDARILAGPARVDGHLHRPVVGAADSPRLSRHWRGHISRWCGPEPDDRTSPVDREDRVCVAARWPAALHRCTRRQDP
ncbi:MAG: hypothetical protein RI958_3276 [Actinomycetota bacterium]|jgi:hypothetical protein